MLKAFYRKNSHFGSFSEKQQRETHREELCNCNIRDDSLLLFMYSYVLVLCEFMLLLPSSTGTTVNICTLGNKNVAAGGIGS